MENLDSSTFSAALRQDLVAFIERSFAVLYPATLYQPNWHIEVIADALEKCRSGDIRRLIINVPPRSLKSHCVAVAFVAYLLGHEPSAQIVCASYAQDLADKHSLDCRTVMMDDFYQKTFRTRISRQKNTTAEFATEEKGFRMATSVGGTLTGRGGDYLIVDDPHKPEEALSDSRRKTAIEWFDHTLRSRLNSQTEGRIILIMQRLHEDDLSGHLLKQGGWTVLSFPAIAEEDETYTVKNLAGACTFSRRRGEALHPLRQPLESLENLRREIGEYVFAGQYQQRPTPLGGGMVKAEWFRRYQAGQTLGTFERVVQSWDTANKATELSDYSVCTTWGIRFGFLYLLHVFRERLEYPALKRMVRYQASRYGPSVILIEDKASGTQLIQDLRAEHLHSVRAYQSSLDKIMRMHAATGSIEGGFVHLPDQAEWLAVFLHEVTTFPNGRHDDQVDSMSQAIDWFKAGRNSNWSGLLEYYQSLIPKETDEPRIECW